jgi:hypothetical protein
MVDGVSAMTTCGRSRQVRSIRDGVPAFVEIFGPVLLS